VNILMEYNRTKTVRYFGITLQVHHVVKYLAVDKNGQLRGYEVRPDCGHSCWIERSDIYVSIGEVDLEGHDWVETLRELDE